MVVSSDLSQEQEKVAMDSGIKVTKEEVDAFLARWERGEFKFQRLGQAFCNTFLDGSESFPELFYEQNNGAAMRRIIHIQQAGGTYDGASKS